MMRVTVGSAAYGALTGMQSTSSRLADLQAQLSSGRQITKPSDNPAGTSTALELRAELKRTSQYQANGSDAIGYLTEVDSTMSSVTAQLQNVRTLVLQGLNTGSNSPSSNEALAQQIDQARAGLLSLSNASYLGRPIFGGNTAGSVAFTLDTGTNAVNYVGDSGTMTRTVGPSTSMDINSIGTAVFGSGASSVFDLLANISNTLRTSPSTMSADLNGDLASIDAAQVNFSTVQSTAGAKYQRIQTEQTSLGTNVIQLKAQLSGLQDVDVADMAIQVSTASTAYQAALAVTAKIQQVSLLDFLR